MEIVIAVITQNLAGYKSIVASGIQIGLTLFENGKIK